MKRIMIIDDDKSILRTLTRVLQKRGYSTDTAETGREAEEKINKQAYDLALIDVKLPDIDGLDLLKKIHATKPDMVKIILTGFPTMENGMKAVDNGADAYLVKPVKTEDLLRVLEEKLRGK